MKGHTNNDGDNKLEIDRQVMVNYSCKTIIEPHGYVHKSGCPQSTDERKTGDMYEYVVQGRICMSEDPKVQAMVEPPRELGTCPAVDKASWIDHRHQRPLINRYEKLFANIYQC